jgi:hypothetical protein
MGHEATGRGGRGLGSARGAHYRHTTPELATRVITAIEARLAVVLSVAEKLQKLAGPGHSPECSDDAAAALAQTSSL